MSPVVAKEAALAAQGVRSLVWDGDSLVDWVSGGTRFHLNGEVTERHVNYAYPFDAAVSSPSGEFAGIYTRTQTKGLLLRKGEIVREINRSFYQASKYEYPIALFRLPSGREVIAHCPDEYNRLEIDDLETGKRLTLQESRRPSDFFHSRLSASSDGRYLLSAGWIWTPVNAVRVFDLAEALKDSAQLDNSGIVIGEAWGDLANAAFLGNREVLLCVQGCEDDDRRSALCTRNLETGVQSAAIYSTQSLGRMMAVGTDHVLSLYEHPRLLERATGDVVQSWPHIASGTQSTSITVGAATPPHVAIDADRTRIAIATEEKIAILQFET
jgi:hypothetical protein